MSFESALLVVICKDRAIEEALEETGKHKEPFIIISIMREHFLLIRHASCSSGE